MPIILNTPISKEPVPQKVADAVWIRDIKIYAPSPTGRVDAYIEVLPMISSTGELFYDDVRMIAVEDVFTECATNPTLAAAVQSIFTAVQDLVTTRNTFGE